MQDMASMWTPQPLEKSTSSSYKEHPTTQPAPIAVPPTHHSLGAQRREQWHFARGRKIDIHYSKTRPQRTLPFLSWDMAVHYCSLLCTKKMQPHSESSIILLMWCESNLACQNSKPGEALWATWLLAPIQGNCRKCSCARKNGRLAEADNCITFLIKYKTSWPGKKHFFPPSFWVSQYISH